MKIAYDTAKNEINITKHGISLEDAAIFEWGDATLCADERKDYGEVRVIATGILGGRLHGMVFTKRGEEYRIISLRKANKRERKNYEEEA